MWFILALASSVFMTVMSLYQFFNTIMSYGEFSFRVSCNGLTIALLPLLYGCLLYTSDAADEGLGVGRGGRRGR